MQSIIDAISSTAQTVTSAVTSATGLGLGAHGHSETHTLPPDSKASAVASVDSDALAVFEDEGVKHEVLVKLNHLAIDDARHGLKELAGLHLDSAGTDGSKKGIDYYHPLRFFTVERPNGIDYIGEIELEKGKAIHVRVHKAAAGAKPTFHSVDTRPGAEGGAVFNTGETLHWFDY